MKKSMIAVSIALLALSLGTSLALAAPVSPAAPQGMMTWPAGEDPSEPSARPVTGPMMTAEQMHGRHQQMNTHQHAGGMENRMKNMPCQPNSTPAK